MQSLENYHNWILYLSFLMWSIWIEHVSWPFQGVEFLLQRLKMLLRMLLLIIYSSKIWLFCFILELIDVLNPRYWFFFFISILGGFSVQTLYLSSASFFFWGGAPHFTVCSAHCIGVHGQWRCRSWGIDHGYRILWTKMSVISHLTVKEFFYSGKIPILLCRSFFKSLTATEGKKEKSVVWTF